MITTISTLLSNITGAFKADYWFASLIPTLLFVFATLLSFGLAIGFKSIDAFVSGYNLTEATLASLGGLLSLLVFSYLINALKTLFLIVWSGRSQTVVRLLGLRRRQNHYEAQFDTARRRILDRDKVVYELEVRLDTLESEPVISQPTDLINIEDIVKAARELNLEYENGRSTALQVLNSASFFHHTKQLNKDTLNQVKSLVRQWLGKQTRLSEHEQYKLSRNFGDEKMIQPTKLGNVIEGYNQYAASRYDIEAEIFWPRLLQMMPESFRGQLDSARLVVEFSLALASLSVVYAALVLFLGPWVLFHWVWLLLAALGLVVALLFYRLAVHSAMQFGEWVRAGYDLYRLDMMAQFQRPRPTTFNQEREQWRELSRLVTYGQATDFTLKEKE